MMNLKLPLAMTTPAGQGVSVFHLTLLGVTQPLAGVLVVCGQTFSKFMGALAHRGFHRPEDPVYSRQPSLMTMPTGKLPRAPCPCQSKCATKKCPCQAMHHYCDNACHPSPSPCTNNPAGALAMSGKRKCAEEAKVNTRPKKQAKKEKKGEKDKKSPEEQATKNKEGEEQEKVEEEEG